MGLNNDNARRIVLDIETVALPDAAGFLETPRAPSNWKDPAKIAQYVAEKQNEEVERAGLDLDLAQIVAIGVMYEGGQEPSVLTAEHATEADMLRWLWQSIGTRVTIGYETLQFDLPMCLRRSLYLGLQAPLLNLDKYRTPHIDLRQVLSHNGAFKWRSLDFYCRRFGLDVPDDSVTGADIPHLVAESNWAAVADHCASDVMKVAALAKRLGYLKVNYIGVPEEAVL